ncbi:MAG: hypothetical protein VB108_09915 [Anaerolineaceae bacterium]|nr:hypothetical protein [Anaerolineaceae bacterium]
MKYKEDYTLITRTDEKGHSKQSVQYNGPLFDLEMSPADLLGLKRLAALLFAGAAASHLGAGFLPHRASYQWYVSLPYAAAYLPIFFLGMALLRLPRQTRALERCQTDSSFNKGRSASLAAIVLLAVGLPGFLLHCFFISGPAFGLLEGIYLILETLSLLMLLGLFSKLNRVRIVKRVDHHLHEMLTEQTEGF